MALSRIGQWNREIFEKIKYQKNKKFGRQKYKYTINLFININSHHLRLQHLSLYTGHLDFYTE